MNTNRKGDIGLTKVIADLTEKGYQCFLPISDTSLIDLVIANKDLVLKSIQVKYIKLNEDGSLPIPMETVVNGKRVLKDVSKIDMIVVYCPDNKNIYYISTKEIKTKNFYLKITESKNGKPLRDGKNYLDIEKVWN